MSMQSRRVEQCDLLVFGAGAAGMTAAVVARHLGLKVILCEKLAQVGGTTASSGGMVFAPGNPTAARAGRADSVECASTYLHAELALDSVDPMVRAFVETAPQAIDFLERHTRVRFDAPLQNPDYHDSPHASSGGRTVVPSQFDGRELGQDFDLVRAPMRSLMVLGGMMVARREVPMLLRPFQSVESLRFCVRSLFRYARDRLAYRRGTRLLLGNALVAALLASMRDAGVQLNTRCALVRLVAEGERVVGAVVHDDEGERTIRARGGVVLATGGFAGSEAWRARLAQDFPVEHSLALAECQGEGLAAGEAVGAVVETGHRSPIFWMPVSVDNRRTLEPDLWMHGVLDRAKPGLIAVDRQGKRFVNEANSYHDFVMAMFAAGLREAFLVCDARFLHRYGLGRVLPFPGGRRDFLRSGYLRRGRTWAALARACDIDAAGLEQTIAFYNGFAREGRDPLFGRGTSVLNRHNGDPAALPNPCVAPLEVAPFYAVAVRPAILGTSAGLRTNADAQACRADGSIIEGLYACGNDMASVMRGQYPGPGITLGPGIVFAYRAAVAAAGSCSGEPDWSPAFRESANAL